MCLWGSATQETDLEETAYLYVEVDLSAPAQVREVSSRFQVRSSGVRIQLIHLLFGFQ